MTSPKEFVYRATMGKYEAARIRYGVKIPLLVADTVIACRNQMLRKAKDREEAAALLALQSGAELSILTCMVFENSSMKLIDLSSTCYKFANFEKNALESYLESNLWVGKAGACMVEGFCKPYILESRGFESTAMGLCVEKLLPFLTPRRQS